MSSRLRSLCAAFGLAALAGACEDPLSITASLPIRTDTLILYALTGTPPTFPNALNTIFAQPVRADGNFGFDVAFDINAANQVVVLPVRLVSGSLDASRRVGVQRSDSAFDALMRAPSTGFRYDSLFVAGLGETIVIQARSRSCVNDLSPLIYSKIVVDSVNLTRRSIHLRITADPNCGFRSFAPGIPTN